MNSSKSHPLLGPVPRRQNFKHGYNPNLTPREAQILRGVTFGWPNKRIATELSISIKTVEKHHSHVNRKTGRNNIPALLHWALRKDPVFRSHWLALERLPA